MDSGLWGQCGPSTRAPGGHVAACGSSEAHWKAKQVSAVAVRAAAEGLAPVHSP